MTRVREAIDVVQPFAVDVCRGVRTKAIMARAPLAAFSRQGTCGVDLMDERADKVDV